MGELRSMHIGALASIYDPDTINAALRAGPKELQDWLGWMFFGDADAGGGVLGFNAAAAALNVTVERGGGLIYAASDPAPASWWSWIYSGEAVVKAISAHHATLARVDLISLTWTQIPDTTVNVGMEGSVPADVETQRGCQVTLTVTAGTAHADPWANKAATPANAEALWYVYVPATAGALVLVDVRRHLPGPGRRPGTAPLSSVTDVDTDAEVFEVLARKADNADTAWLSSLSWDAAQDWPYITRGKGAAGDEGASLYPLMALGRSWWRTVPFLGGNFIDSVAANLLTLMNDTNALLVSRLAAAEAISTVYVGIPVEARGLELSAAKLRYKTTEAFDATVGASGRAFKLLHLAADGTVTELASQNVTIASIFDGCAAPVSLTLGSTPTFVEGDSLVARFILHLTASGTASLGALELHGVDLQFTEGRA